MGSQVCVDRLMYKGMFRRGGGQNSRQTMHYVSTFSPLARTWKPMRQAERRMTAPIDSTIKDSRRYLRSIIVTAAWPCGCFGGGCWV